MRISDWSSDVCSSDLGAPKVRAMEIIDALEPTKRGPYAGVVGYLDFSGNIDTDRKSVVSGKSVSVRVDLGGRRIIKKKKDRKSMSIEIKKKQSNVGS